MSHFYQQLSHIEELGRPVRIAYFGDSFVEGDILSCDLREQLQTRFGGQGVGWIDCASQVHNFRQTVRHTFSGVKEYEVVKKPFKTQVQSLAQRYFMAEYGKATMHYEGVKARKHLKSWQRASFFFRSDEMFSLTTVINNDTTFCDSIEGNGQLQVITHTLPSIHNITYTVEGAGSDTYLYGTALESRQGIIVDNFSMRGSSGVTIGSIPASVLHEFARHRAYDLIILHFGLNVASDKSQDGNYKAYTRQMGQAIQHLRGAYPSASVLIVSMPDRDQRTDMGIHTMMGVESLVAYQQLMASDQQVAFFNLFEAMGGHESMKGLVDDGLANKDYTHLTFGGGRRLAKKLVESIEAGFDIYKQQHP
jgi:lysophospholipase L1-like esterase